MAAPITTWAVTEIAHPGLRDVSEDCKECLAYADTAIVHAQVTGSTGCTYGEGNNAGHSCTVARALAVIVFDPSKD